MVMKTLCLLCIMLPKMNTYRSDSDETKYIYFLINSNKLPEKYNRFWDKFSNIIKRGFDGEPVYNDEYLKMKIKSYEGKLDTNFDNEKKLLPSSVFRKM